MTLQETAAARGRASFLPRRCRPALLPNVALTRSRLVESTRELIPKCHKGSNVCRCFLRELPRSIDATAGGSGRRRRFGGQQRFLSHELADRLHPGYNHTRFVQEDAESDRGLVRIMTDQTVASWMYSWCFYWIGRSKHWTAGLSRLKHNNIRTGCRETTSCRYLCYFEDDLRTWKFPEFSSSVSFIRGLWSRVKANNGKKALKM